MRCEMLSFLLGHNLVCHFVSLKRRGLKVSGHIKNYQESGSNTSIHQHQAILSRSILYLHIADLHQSPLTLRPKAIMLHD